MFYFFIFLASLILSAILTLAIKKIALVFKIVDLPDKDNEVSRKIHKEPIPLLGGVAIFLAYFILLFSFSSYFLAGNLRITHLISFFLGALIIVIGGTLDDKYNLSPKLQIIFPLIAIIILILGGVGIDKITNPFGGYLYLKSFFFIGPLLVSIWLLGMMYTTKLLDGVDGLVSGVSAIGGLVIFLFTLTTRYFQPDIAFASILLVGSVSGFLIFNWNPAKIFLGEGGSLLLGYILGVLAIISGGKIAIALLVMGIPILDVAWTIIRRLLKGKNPFRFADKKHLHHRLLGLGLSQKKTVLIFYFFSLVFGLSGLFLQSRGKFLVLIFLLVLMFLMVGGFYLFDLSQERKNKENNKESDKKPSLLLHICCAPCSTFISRDILLPSYDLTWYFLNPNLNSQEEYDKRLEAVKLMAEKYNIPLIVEPYDHSGWLSLVNGHENDKERGQRCQICYYNRLIQTAELAKQKEFTYFSTSLLVSPYKDKKIINKICTKLAKKNKIKFLNLDFQANDAYRKSQELAKKLGIYRQKFCGCEFSLRK
ncbi:MAG: epoxyqueuosine reductase QueH [Patescibacteria group bacterium]